MTTTFDWAGRVGESWASEWRRTDRSFGDLSRRLNATILAAAPDNGKAIDIGCGAGGTAIALAGHRPGLAITGVDLSPQLIEAANRRAADIENLSFRVADATATGASDLDLLFSRHGVMFFDDPVAGFAALRQSARRGAPLIFSCFRERAASPWLQVIDAAVGNPASAPGDYAPGPFALADRDFTRQVLTQAGWGRAEPVAIDFNYVAGAGDDPVDDALGFFSTIGSAARTIAAAPDEQRDGLLRSLRQALVPHYRDGVVAFPAGAWIWTAFAGDPA